MKATAHYVMRLFLPIMLLAIGTSAAVAFCNTDVVSLDEILGNKERFDNKLVCVEGIASRVKETTSCAGNDYTTIVVSDPKNGRKITVFAWGHLGIKTDAPIQCSGKFQIKKVVQSRCDGQVRRIPFYDQMEGLCSAK